MSSSVDPLTGDDDTSTSTSTSTTTSAAAEANPFSAGAGGGAAAAAAATTRVVPGGTEWWRRSFAYMTNMGMTASERAEFEADRELKREQDQCRRCEKWRDYNLNYSPTVRFLTTHIETLRPGTVSQEIVRCLPCNKFQSGGFSPHFGILLCQNRLLSRSHTEDTLAHEMMHLHDHIRFDIDWLDLRHHACAEIRASNLSGECRWTREAFGRRIWDFTKHHQDCVRRRAALSVRGHPACVDEAHAAKVVNQVFDSCFRDTRPFDEIYR